MVQPNKNPPMMERLQASKVLNVARMARGDFDMALP
jgi:hypothetical protein